jgi:YVTN family beta-propeller protein
VYHSLSDQKTPPVCSRLHNALYSYLLPDLKLAGTVFLSGKGAQWVTATPDGKRVYVADTVTEYVLVVDIATMKEVAKIKVGHVPKRSNLMIIGGAAGTRN